MNLQYENLELQFLFHVGEKARKHLEAGYKCKISLEVNGIKKDEKNRDTPDGNIPVLYAEGLFSCGFNEAGKSARKTTVPEPKRFAFVVPFAGLVDIIASLKDNSKKITIRDFTSVNSDPKKPDNCAFKEGVFAAGLVNTFYYNGVEYAVFLVSTSESVNLGVNNGVSNGLAAGGNSVVKI